MLFPLTAGQQAMKYAIGRIATGPHLSKDLTREEARAAMAAVLRGEIDPIQTAVFLIALRMKRETDEEFLGLLDALAEVCPSVVASVPTLAILADPFDGFNRSLPASPFLPALLAACGLPTLAIGVTQIGPKYGTTHALVLKAAGCCVDLTPPQAAEQIDRCGWAYCDQSRYSPSLYALLNLRNTMIKRTPLTTLETVAMPVKGTQQTHQLAGYVHPPYARLYALLAQAAGFSSALIMKGVEGGFIPSLRQPSKWIRFVGQASFEEGEIDPATLGITQPVRAPLLPNERGDVAETEVEKEAFDALGAARAAAAAGTAALHGEHSATADALVLGAALALWQCGLVTTPQEGAALAREALVTGKAWETFQQAKKT